jgi:hypothetical protein
MSQEGINAPRPNIFLTKTVGEFPTALRNFIKRVRGLEVRGSRGDITKEVGRERGIYKGAKEALNYKDPTLVSSSTYMCNY